MGQLFSDLGTVTATKDFPTAAFRRIKMNLYSSVDPGADRGVNQQVEGVRVSGVAGPTPLSSCPAESSEPGLCGGVCVLPEATGCVGCLCPGCV